MKNNSPKIPIFLSSLFLCVALFLLLFFHRAINNNSTESQSRETEWKTEAARRDEIKALDLSVKNIEGERAQLESHFAQSSDVVPFLDTVESLATSVNTKAEVTSVDIAKDQTGLIVGMKASGSFGGLYKFLNLLENAPYELQFLSMEMQKNSVVTSAVPGVKTPPWSMILRIKLISFIN